MYVSLDPFSGIQIDSGFTHKKPIPSAPTTRDIQRMDNWRQDRYSSVSKALRRIEKRADKLVRRINTSSLKNKWKQDRQVFVWEDEVARLQEMTDRLTDFRDRLYFYSNLDYIEALNEWEYEIEK